MRNAIGSEPARVTAAVCGPPLLAELAVAALALQGMTALGIRVAAWVAATALVVVLVVRPLLEALAAARLEVQDGHAELARMCDEQDFRARLERGLTQAESESSAVRATLRATQELCPDADVALLLAVPDEARVGWTVRVADGELLPARPIPGTPGCAALAGHTAVSTDSSALDACAHLEDPDMEVSASCIPLSVEDRVLGVVSVVQAPGEAPDEHRLSLLEWVVERTSVRVCELRRARGSRRAVRGDSTTGLPGPETLDAHLRDSFRSLVPFCVTLVDIDDFEGLEHLWSEQEVNDSLRTMADALRLTLRPNDLICRIKRGRFAAVLDNCGAAEATLAMERVRESLALSLTTAGATPFTFSAGVVESHRAKSIEDCLEQARSAARLAHGNGGNRVALAHD